ncbi:hypothetical protein [Bdellovibrio reynosensis]|uniref:Uncharacterized protein n=1 Tax=Bdellovibrio reynosensis TaxID=2835041 RepID=A0ABY4C578_9BACT|nr:hypothetical protein [Bdellovibrio reynosensis]UOF00111.1 hypothetical protein MNR06_10400 [Bdellovibrio reynosensis]
MKKLISFVFILVLLFQSVSSANFSDEGMSRETLVDSLKKNTSLNQEQIDQLILSLQQAFKVEPGEKIPVRGYLYAAGMNGALLFDHDVWLFDAVLSIPGVSEPVKVPELFLCDFHNGGLKFEVAYKWMFSFIPSGVTVNELHGALYGRGLGLVAEAFLGLEGSWLPAKNRPHDLFHIAIKLGFGGGVVFPKMEFKLRNITGNASTVRY